MVIAAKPKLERNGSEFFLAGQSPALLQNNEIKSVKNNSNSDKLLISDILREWMEDKKIDSDLSVVTENNGIKKDDFLSKLKKVTRVKNVSLIISILEAIEILQDSVPTLDLAAASKLKKEIFHMKEVVFGLSRCGNGVLKDVEIKSVNKKHTINNLLYCNRVVCPNCASYISSQRIALLTPLLKKIIQNNEYDLFFMSNTIRHKKGVKFKVVRKVMYKIWHAMTDLRWFEDCKGFIKNAECSENGGSKGSNGIHLHFHSIVALPKNYDSDGFARKVESYWQKKARKLGRSVDWSKQKNREWFKPIQIQDLERVVKYFTCYDEPKQLRDYSILDEVLSSKQKNKNIWNVNPRMFCEIYRDSKNMRWYSDAGIFKQNSEPETEIIEPVIVDEGKASEQIIMKIPAHQWKKLDFGDRFIIRDIVANRLLTDRECIEAIQKILDENIQNQLGLF